MITVTKPDLPPLEEYMEYLKKIWTSKWLTNDGEYVQSLKRKLEEHLKTKDLVLVSNGTLAIELALKVLNIKGEVITSPFTFPATTNSILWEKLTPVFADVDPETFNIDPREVEKRITQKTSAILAVHVFGNPCYVKELQEIAHRHDVKLIYDAAAAFDVEYENQSVLNYGDLSILSFHATKVFHTVEGGAIAVKDERLCEKLSLLRDHGIKSAEHVAIVGTNAKMNEFQAVMGICNLKYVDKRIQRRKRLYEYYNRRLSKHVKFQKLTASKYNYGCMPVCFEDIEERDKVHSRLLKNGIEPRKYFFPLTTSSDYFKKEGADLVKKYDLRNAYDISNRILCLPLYPDLKTQDVNRVIKIIEDTLDTKES